MGRGTWKNSEPASEGGAQILNLRSTPERRIFSPEKYGYDFVLLDGMFVRDFLAYYNGSIWYMVSYHQMKQKFG